MDKDKLIETAKELLIGKTCEFCVHRRVWKRGHVCFLKNDMKTSFNGSCDDWFSNQKIEMCETVEEILDREG